jgi:chromosomal replication initiation ATPase DnaA
MVMIFSVCNEVITRYGISETELLFAGRDNAAVVAARKVVAYILREKLHYSLWFIGQLLNYRDHSTVIYNVKMVQKEQHFLRVADEIWNHIRDNATVEALLYLKQRQAIELRPTK